MRTETALDWFQRSSRHVSKKPKDPSSAALHFVRGNSGIAPIDAAWKNTSGGNILLTGTVGKTWTLISLAARFVVATRPTLFAKNTNNEDNDDNDNNNNNNNNNNDEHHKESSTNPYPNTNTNTTEDLLLPQVIILDSTFDMTHSKISQVVRSTLLRQSPPKEEEEEESIFQEELEDCLERIHIATVDDMLGWVPVLECLRPESPTLVLWDGFLSETNSTCDQMEVIRQVSRLLLQQNHDRMMATVLATRNSNHNLFGTTIPIHRIRLERRLGNDCVATVYGGSKISFSLSLGGILS